jgi:hypothetical protein
MPPKITGIAINVNQLTSALFLLRDTLGIPLVGEHHETTSYADFSLKQDGQLRIVELDNHNHLLYFSLEIEEKLAACEEKLTTAGINAQLQSLATPQYIRVEHSGVIIRIYHKD